MSMPGMTLSHPKIASDPDKLFMQAVALQEDGRLHEAEVVYRDLLEVFPDHLDVTHNLVRLLLASGRIEMAFALWDSAAARRPQDARPHLEKASIHATLGQAALAETELLAAAGLAADDVVWRQIAGTYVSLRRYDLAVDAFQRALSLGPQEASNYSGFASLCNILGDYILAADIARAAIQLSGSSGVGWLELGNALMHQGQDQAATEAFSELARLRPDSPDAYCNLGLIHQEAMRLDEAVANFDKALALDPGHEMARWNRSLALLTQGKLASAWPDYELRRSTAIQEVRALPTCPEWRGEPLRGKTILLIHEQGLGDSLQFIRYASLLQEQGARVWVRVPDCLVRIFQRAAGVDRVLSEQNKHPGDVDYYSLLLSLPLRFATTLETIPGHTPYLFPDPTEVEEWRQRLAHLPGPRVGIVWAGGERRHHAASVRLNQRRNLSLPMLAPVLARTDISFVSLQKGEAAEEISAGNYCHRISEFSALLHDMAATAALVANLDLVIGVDTSVIHLTGALGKPVWLLNRFDTDWRWLTTGNSSPWYSSLRQFRQPTPGDWMTPIQEVSYELIENN